MKAFTSHYKNEKIVEKYWLLKKFISLNWATQTNALKSQSMLNENSATRKETLPKIKIIKKWIEHTEDYDPNAKYKQNRHDKEEICLLNIWKFE